MSFDQNGPFFKLVTLRVRAQPAPGRSCILSSGLVTTKNRRPSAEAGLSPPLREATGRERGSRPRPRPCGCCRQWARSRAGLGVQRVGWGPPPTPAPLPAPGLRSLRGWGPGGGLAGSEASARLPGAGRQVAGSRSRPRATRGERGPPRAGPGRAAAGPSGGARWPARPLLPGRSHTRQRPCGAVFTLPGGRPLVARFRVLQRQMEIFED